MIGRGRRSGAARLLCAAGAGMLFAVPAFAQVVPAQQQPPPRTTQELDPNAPLAPMPDLGVEWPQLDAKSAAPAPQPTTQAAKKLKPRREAEATGTLRYTTGVEGLPPLGNAEVILKQFRQQSTLEAERKDPANAAQIGRRASADADLLTQLLRSQGYYDAAVEPRTERSGDALRVILSANPGVQYRFTSVELPGLEAAGPDAAKLRNAFAVKAGDPVIAEDVIGGGEALIQALGEDGFAQAKLGDQDVEVNHQTHLASLTLPVTPGPIALFGAIHVSGRPPFNAHHVGIIARFKRGDQFKRSKIDDLRRALIATTLVANADIKIVPMDKAASLISMFASSRRRSTRLPATSATVRAKVR